MGHGLVRLPLVSTIERFMARFPGMALTVKNAPTRDVISLVRDDDAHFGVILDKPSEPRIKSRLVVPYPLCLVACPGHPLLARAEVDIDELAGHRLVLPDEGYRVRHLLREAERQNGITFHTVLTASSIQTVVDAVAAGIGATVIPAGCAEDLIAAGRLHAVPIRSEALRNSQVHVIVRLGRQLPAAAITLLDDLARNCRPREKARAPAKANSRGPTRRGNDFSIAAAACCQDLAR